MKKSTIPLAASILGIGFALAGSFAVLPCLSQPLVRQTFPPLTSPPQSTFSNFNHDPAFAAAYLAHLQPMAKSDNELFHGIWFLSDDAKAAMVCGVDTNGNQYSGRLVYNWAFQGSDSLRLGANRLKALRSALHSLPPSSGRVSAANLLLLEYKDGDIWMRREYDRKHLPEQVRQVYRLVGTMI